MSTGLRALHMGNACGTLYIIPVDMCSWVKCFGVFLFPKVHQSTLGSQLALEEASPGPSWYAQLETLTTRIFLCSEREIFRCLKVSLHWNHPKMLDHFGYQKKLVAEKPQLHVEWGKNYGEFMRSSSRGLLVGSLQQTSSLPSFTLSRYIYTLQGTNISHLGKRNIIFKSALIYHLYN